MKYYVQCGELRRVVLADSPENAAWQAILQARGEQLDNMFYIDERGFRGCDGIVDTSSLPQWTIRYQDVVEDDYED